MCVCPCVGQYGHGYVLAAGSRISKIQRLVTAGCLSTLWLSWPATGMHSSGSAVLYLGHSQ